MTSADAGFRQEANWPTSVERGLATQQVAANFMAKDEGNFIY